MPEPGQLSDVELLRRYAILYPKPTKFQQASIVQLRSTLAEGGEDAERLRRGLLARMADVSDEVRQHGDGEHSESRRDIKFGCLLGKT